MTQSQVSSGFWANAPRGVEQHVTFLEKTPISLKLPNEEDDPAEALYQRDDGTWNCIWLPRKTGAGFSGGWRGFAIDLNLFPGDVCVFEIDESSKPASGGSVDVLIVHIFRAFDYDSVSEREKRKEQAAEEAKAAALLAEAEEKEDEEEDELEFEKEESSDEEEDEAEEDAGVKKIKFGTLEELSNEDDEEEEQEEDLFEKIDEDDDEDEEEEEEEEVVVPVAAEKKKKAANVTTTMSKKTKGEVSKKRKKV
jgi:hypothetical protein